jgi:urease accessory protein
VLLLGLAVAFAAHAPLGAAAGAVGLFALWHGAAHGYEVPVAATPVLYAAGMALATAVLHGCGAGVGLRLRSAWLRAAGGVIAAAGAAQLLIA